MAASSGVAGRHVARTRRTHAYAIQKRLVLAHVKDEATHISGIKLGLTSVAKQKQMSVGEPIYGLLIGSRMIDEGEPLAISSLIHPKAEPEIAIVTSRDLQGPGVTPIRPAKRSVRRAARWRSSIAGTRTSASRSPT